jgi:hypothetical protein
MPKRATTTSATIPSDPPAEPTAAESSAPGFSYTKWYQEHRKDFNAARQKRYAADPTHRAKVLAWNRSSRRKKREAVLQEQAEQSEAVAVDLDKRKFKTSLYVQRNEDGSATTLEVYSIGALALFLNRSIQVLRLWESDGVIPATPYRTDKGDRLYTKELIQQIHDILERTGRLRDQGKRQNQRLRPFVYHVKFKDGTKDKIALYKVGVLASALQRTIVTIEQMEAREALPETPFRASATRYRLYTLEMIRAVREAFENHESDVRGEEKRLSFYAAVLEAWEEQGVMGAKLGKPVPTPDVPPST